MGIHRFALMVGLGGALAFASARVLATQSASSSPALSDVRAGVERYVSTNQQGIVRELVELLSIPNVAADRENIRKNAAMLQGMLAKRGFDATLLETTGN